MASGAGTRHCPYDTSGFCMILVSGAGGKTGLTVVDALVTAGQQVRAWVRSPRKTAAHDTFIGDMLSQDDWREAMDGVTKLYHICPNMFADEERVGRYAIQSARQANCNHFVYHSVLHPQTETMPHHWQKLRVEEMLLESGLPFTIVQPAAYMQNIDIPTVIESGVFVRPYPIKTCLSLVDLVDVGATAEIILRDERFVGATLELVGTRPLSQIDVAGVIGAVCGRAITPQEQPTEEWIHTNTHLPQYVSDTLVAMFRYYAAYGFVGNRFTLKTILGCEPSTLHDYVSRILTTQ